MFLYSLSEQQALNHTLKQPLGAFSQFGQRTTCPKTEPASIRHSEKAVS